MSYYDDPYLAPLVTTDRAQRAAQDIALAGTFPDDWRYRLEAIRTYILTCIESTVSTDDAFAVKLSYYRKEYQQTLTTAKAAVASEAGTAAVFASVPLERG